MSKVKINVRQVAETRGVNNPRDLSLKTGITYSVCYRMWYEADQTRLDLNSLARLCDFLECQPGDLLLLIDSGRASQKRFIN